MSSQLKVLFTPIKLGSMELKNRIVMAPMVTNYSTVGGAVTERQIAYYAARARGGVGMIDVEATAMDARGKITSRNLCIHDDKLVPGLRKLVDAIHAGGAKATIEIVHSGRRAAQAVVGVQPVAPSAIPYGGGEVPRELSVEEIQGIVEGYGQAARRAKEAGFDAINIHGSHGYLVTAFLSPHSNKRTDQYGGSLENRTRFVIEIIDRLRRELGQDFPLFCRLSGAEFVDGGLTIEDTKAIARILEKAGLNALDISCGSAETPYISEAPMAMPRGFLVDFAAAVKQVVGIPVITVSRINDPVLAERILVEGKADLIGMGRALLADPELPKKAAEGRLEDIAPCIACMEGCIERLSRDLTVTCMVNPLAGRELQFPVTPAKGPRRVLVAGGGPGGMEAALVAAQRGHHVTLCEKESELGGVWTLSGVPPYKDEVRNLIPYLTRELAKAGVEVKTNSEVDLAVVEKLEPEVIVVATGSSPVGINIPGAKGENVATAWNVLRDRATVGRRVVVIGGGEVGCETAEYLADLGKEVVVIEMLGGMALDLGSRARKVLLDRLIEKDVDLIVAAKVMSIEGSDVVFDKSGLLEKLQGIDTVVMATGAVPERKLVDLLAGRGYEVHLVGDSIKPRKGLDAMHEGFAVGRAI